MGLRFGRMLGLPLCLVLAVASPAWAVVPEVQDGGGFFKPETIAKANDLLKQIRAGASFDEIAKKNSAGPSAAQGGDLGVFKRGTLAKELEDKTFAMKSGQITDVIRTKQGYVILKVTDHQMAGIPPMKEVTAKIQDALYYEKLQPALRAYLTKLREDAYIKVADGYVDTGHSANETQPVETNAAKEADAKNLKKKKKLPGKL